MPKGFPSPKEMRFYFSLATVGMEMVTPLGVGILLDYSLGWTPWGTVVGFALGFVGGFVHLLMLVNRHEAEERPGPPRGPGA